MDTTVDEKVCPLVFPNIGFWKLFEKQDGDIYCLGSIDQDKFIEVPEIAIMPIMTIIKYFDGKHTIEDINFELLNKHDFKIDVEQLYTILCRANLIQNVDESLVEKQELDILTTKLFEIKIKKNYWLLEKLNTLIFPYGLYFSVIIIICGLFFMIKSIEIFISPSSYQIENSYFLGIVFTIISFLLSISLHELSHGIVGYRYGLKPSKLVFALYLALSPMIYLKMPGIYTIKPKKRIYVWLAGIYANLLLGSVFMIISQFTSDNLKNILTLLALTNISLVISNLSPLLPLDGYFVMCTLLKKPNLRKGSFKEFKKWVLGKKNNFRGLAIIYFIFSSLFMGGLILSQIYWIFTTIIKSIKDNYSIYQVLLEFKFILVLISILIIKKIVGFIVKKLKTHRYHALNPIDDNHS